MSPDHLIYKIVSRQEWNKAEAAGVFMGAEIDLIDGYIHFSTATQVAETATKHFSGRNDLLLVAVDTRELGNQLKWEPSRGGDLFPHLYSALSLTQVKSVQSIKLDDKGKHCLPWKSN